MDFNQFNFFLGCKKDENQYSPNQTFTIEKAKSWYYEKIASVVIINLDPLVAMKHGPVYFLSNQVRIYLTGSASTKLGSFTMGIVNGRFITKVPETFV